MNTPLVAASAIGAGYAGSEAIKDVTFAAFRGERIGVLGPNGGGKTTLLRVLAGTIEPGSGDLTVTGLPATAPQSDSARDDYPVSALDVATMGALPRLPWWRSPGRAERKEATDALTEVGLAGDAHKLYGKLSGGQRQRTLIARALVQRAEIVLLDEPFNGLDATSAAQLEGLISQLAEHGRTIFIATHDVNRARGWEKVLCINRKQIGFGAPEEVLDRESVEATYGDEMIDLSGENSGLLKQHDHHLGLRESAPGER